MFIETPRGKIITSKNGNAKLIWNQNFKPKWEGKFHKAQVYVDQEVVRLSDKFIPFQTGMLKKSGLLGTEYGTGKVQYLAPYGRYQYYGKVMIGKAPKKVTDKNLKYNQAPKRGSFWFERMKAEYKENILNGARRMLKED